MDSEKTAELINSALSVRKRAYSKYSGFSVGAALLTDQGSIYTGANIENVSYPVGICAERSAFASAISAGERSFTALAVAGDSSDKTFPENFCMPCGMCRQFISEFCKEDFTIIIAKSAEEYKTYKLSALLPSQFGIRNA